MSSTRTRPHTPRVPRQLQRRTTPRISAPSVDPTLGPSVAAECLKDNNSFCACVHGSLTIDGHRQEFRKMEKKVMAVGLKRMLNEANEYSFSEYMRNEEYSEYSKPCNFHGYLVLSMVTIDH